MEFFFLMNKTKQSSIQEIEKAESSSLLIHKMISNWIPNDYQNETVKKEPVKLYKLSLQEKKTLKSQIMRLGNKTVKDSIKREKERRETKMDISTKKKKKNTIKYF
jgi:hypothetical protein